MKTVTYAIGDIHGRLDLLLQVLERIEADAEARGARAKIVLTGDYLDRGAESFGVVERLIAGPRRANDTFVCLRGNHDDLFATAVTRGEGLPQWAWMLFWHTITSYGVDRDTMHTNCSALRRHAGIRPGIPLDRQTDEDLLWIRAEFLDHPEPLPRRVVHGHTIMGDQPVVTLNRVSIDTGAYKSGRLTAAVLDGETVSFLQAVGEPDRGAIVREVILVETIAGRSITPAMQDALASFKDGAIDADEFARLLHRPAIA